MSETPQTDSEAMDGICCYGDPLKSWDYKASKDGEVVPAEFAGRLERERDEARRELAEAMNALQWIVGAYCHEKSTFQLAQLAYEMSSKARWTLNEIEQKEEA